MIKKIVILGDFNPDYSTHHALNESVQQVRNVFNKNVVFDWIGTDDFNTEVLSKNVYSGIWIAPGSPYKDMQNVLTAVTYARCNNVPAFGNCGGFQHMIIEFARNVCGITCADHEETNPHAPDLLVSKLSCSLVEQEEELKIIKKESILFKIVQKETLPGRYFCSYGLNQKYIDILQSCGLVFTAASDDGELRAFELEQHPFFMGTLFQPALTSTLDKPNPLIIEFVRTAITTTMIKG